MRMRWVGHVAKFGEMSNVYKILVVKAEDKTYRHRRDDDIKVMNLWFRFVRECVSVSI